MNTVIGLQTLLGEKYAPEFINISMYNLGWKEFRIGYFVLSLQDLTKLHDLFASTSMVEFLEISAALEEYLETGFLCILSGTLDMMPAFKAENNTLNVILRILYDATVKTKLLDEAYDIIWDRLPGYLDFTQKAAKELKYGE